MKVYIAHADDNRIGGGWSWISNAVKAGIHNSTYEECDIYLIPSPSMVSKEEVDKAQADGKKIVLRCDNIVRNSRNRNTGMSRMKRYAEQADLVIYQSEFAKNLLMPFLKTDGVVILNGCDTNIFNPKGRQEDTTAKFIYSRFNRDETKGFEMARFIYQHESLKRNGDTTLNIVGQFSSELTEYNFDFYMGESYNYWGVIMDHGTMASILKNSDYFIYTYWNDACSNAAIEALCCGCTIIDYYGMRYTGGMPEILEHYDTHGIDYFSLERMGLDYAKALSSL